MSDSKYLSIVKHYESCLEKHGDSHLGVDWPNLADSLKRYSIMLQLSGFLPPKEGKYTLLDFGCGAGHLLQFIKDKNINDYEYSGLDLSSKFITLCREKFPGVWFEQLDVMREPDRLPDFDLIVMNGVFTEKRELTFDEMWEYFQKLLEVIVAKARIGVAFNVMSKQVDWERDDLFHVSMDDLASYLVRNFGRKFVFRSDYGLYEYTVYLYK